MNTILFDFDGTIADTLPVIFYSFQQVFMEFEQRTVSKEDVREMFGPTEEGMIRKYFANQELIEPAIETFYDIYRAHHSRLVQPSDDIVRLLQRLKAKNVQFAIVTGKGRACCDISMEALGLQSYFDRIVTGDDVTAAKPHPEGILNVLTELHVKKSEAMFVGDSNADIEAGQRAGLRTIGVQWLSESQTNVFRPVPDLQFSRVAEFEEYLETCGW